jgi:dinuclear metal center YbgI/SA1388 family protein
MKVLDIIKQIEVFAPPVYQESYDNAGLIVGDENAEIESVLISLDVTEDIVDEAIDNGAGLIIAHHPILFKSIKRLTPTDYVNRTIIRAIKNDIAIYAAHTNVDAVFQGVNMELANQFNLVNNRVLIPQTGKLQKVFCYVPENHVETLRNAIFETGAGQIGNYDACSFNVTGLGTFRAGENTKPFVGNYGKIHFEPETRVEIVFPEHLQSNIIDAIKRNHPYEEPAYDIINLQNAWEKLGIGVIGEFNEPIPTKVFLDLVKSKLRVPVLKYTKSNTDFIRKLAICGGAGSFLIKTAMRSGADAFLTSDVKYHEFFDAENRMTIVDAGHYETEQFTKELFYRIITKKFPNFAVQISKRNTNPVNYY